MTRRIGPALLAGVLLLAPAAGARADGNWNQCANVGYGPLHLYSQSPFQALRLGILPTTPSTLPRGRHEVRATATWVNIWAREADAFLDFEMLQGVVALDYGLTDRLQIETEVQDRSRFGGLMDGLIQGFHDWFRLDQDGRDQVPRGAFTFDLNPPGGPAVSLGRGARGTFSRSLQVSLRQNLACGDARRPAVSYDVTARLETIDARDLSHGNDVDLGASLALAGRSGPTFLYGTIGYARFGKDRFRGIPIRNGQVTALFAVEWRVRPRNALIFQYLWTQGLVPGFAPFSAPSNEVTLGWKWELAGPTLLEAGVIENLFSFDNSPDFGVHIGLSRRF
jgi:Protein of unknown function (DUF3187)